MSELIRYAVIGDSYSCGEGANPEEAWPVLLTRGLTSKGLQIELVSNPARTGWTTQDAIDHELPLFRDAQPNFATLMLGVNDWVQGVEPDLFRARFTYLMNEMGKELPGSNRLLVINIPDFSVTPKGPEYSRGRDIAAGLARFNQIIAEECLRLSLTPVDIFPLSQRMRNDPELIAADGLHPSAKAYAEWVGPILPAAIKCLTGV